MGTKTKAKAAPVVEELDDDLEELDEELELEDLDDEVEEEAPKKAKAEKAKKVEDDVWGVRNGLIPLLLEKTGKDYTPREVRTLLRKMARDNGRINRDIVPGNKSRYAWSGPEDKEVKAIIKAVTGGEIEASKKAALDALKSKKAAKDAATTPVAKKKVKKVAPPVDDDDEDDDE